MSGSDRSHLAQLTSLVGVTHYTRPSFLNFSSNLSTVVSRAFQILSDADKKAKYDKFGGDPPPRRIFREMTR